jgi:hypothetical protein
MGARAPVPVLLITGPVGVGKTTVAFEVSEQLEARGIAHAYIDADVVYLYPTPADPAMASTLDERNLGALWSNLRAAGAPRLLLTRVLQERAHLETIRRAVSGAEIVVVRLEAPYAEVEARIRRRELGSGVEWHLRRAAESLRAWGAEPVEDHLVETVGRSVGEIAGEVLRRSGWLPPAGGVSVARVVPASL